MIDEMAARRPDFRPDVKVRLADGQDWFLPRPMVTFTLSFAADDGPGFKRSDLGFGPDYMDLLQRFYDSDGAEQLNAAARMVCRVVRLNYDLDDETLATLLVYRPSDESNLAMWSELVDIATGNPSPKGGPEDDG